MNDDNVDDGRIEALIVVNGKSIYENFKLIVMF